MLSKPSASSLAKPSAKWSSVPVRSRSVLSYSTLLSRWMALLAISGSPRLVLPPGVAPAVAPPAPGVGPAPVPGIPPDALAVAPPGVEPMPEEEPPRPGSLGAPPTAVLGPASILAVQAARNGPAASTQAGATSAAREFHRPDGEGVDQVGEESLGSRIRMTRLLRRRGCHDPSGCDTAPTR